IDNDLGIYEVGKFLGEGAFGKVAKCSKLGSNECFAIKMVDDMDAGMDEAKAIGLIKSLDPDVNNLLKFHESFKYLKFMCLVYEILDQSLESLMRKNSFRPTHLCAIRAIAQQLLVALSALKSINVFHGDIKLDNIMMVNQDSTPYKVKLIDFGLATDSWDLQLGALVQIVPFRAPQVSLGLPLGVGADMWSLGVVLASLYFGKLPFTYDEEYDTIRCVVQWFGLPEDEPLFEGLFTSEFFTFEKDCSKPGWRFNSPSEYTQKSGEAVRRLNTIPDLDQMKEILGFLESGFVTSNPHPSPQLHHQLLETFPPFLEVGPVSLCLLLWQHKMPYCPLKGASW
uniref:Protein kinase domain-containing protein n=1 Tax=Oryzias latipes TaxID=8090 RepID=A0A3B3I2M9_ORYLA